MNRRGFAWYELLMALATVSSVTALSIPMYADYGRQAVATQMLADVDSLRAGVFRFYSSDSPRESFNVNCQLCRPSVSVTDLRFTDSSSSCRSFHGTVCPSRNK